MMPEFWVHCVSGVAATVTAAIIIRRFIRSEQVWPNDIVVLHQIPRGPLAPSMSNYAMKLETYLRMVKIPYMNDFSGRQSSKGKVPSITYNGVSVADSQFCIEYLNKKLEIDLNQQLSPEQKAVAKAFQRLVEDNLYWLMILWRYVSPDFKKMALRALSTFNVPFKRLFMEIGMSIVWKQAYGQGLARHSEDEWLHISDENLKALSDFLGSKKYMMGDTVSEVDCTVFAMLAQLVWQLPGSAVEHLANDKYPNLRDYSYRMKDEYWPDWDDCITHGTTRKATK